MQLGAGDASRCLNGRARVSAPDSICVRASATTPVDTQNLADTQIWRKHLANIDMERCNDNVLVQPVLIVGFSACSWVSETPVTVSMAEHVSPLRTVYV
jgi:hypothetical protein